MEQTRDYESTEGEKVPAPRRMFPGPAGAPREDAHAVVIGIDQYVDARIPDLRYARADAEAVYHVLVDPQYGRFKEENVTLLIDENATQKKIRSAIGTHLPRRAARDHTVCLYFAGHGAPVIDPRSRSRDGLEKYLVPHDAEADDLRATGIPMTEIQQFFEWIDTSQLIFFIDSCYSGSAGGAGGRSFEHTEFTTRAALTDDFLEHMSGDGRMIVTACGTNEVSLESPAIEHGVFTYYLVEGLKGAADSGGDGLVTLDELYDYVYRNVERQARSMGGSMNPIRKGFVQGTVYLSRYETQHQARARELSPAAEAAFERGSLDEAERLWLEIAALIPDDEHAVSRIASIAASRAKEQRRLEEEKRRRKEVLRKKQRALLEYGRKGALPAQLYANALDLVERDTATLSETDRLVRELIEELVAGRLTPSQYVRSVELATSAGEPGGEIAALRPTSAGPEEAPVLHDAPSAAGPKADVRPLEMKLDEIATPELDSTLAPADPDSAPDTERPVLEASTPPVEARTETGSPADRTEPHPLAARSEPGSPAHRTEPHPPADVLAGEQPIVPTGPAAGEEPLIEADAARDVSSRAAAVVTAADVTSPATAVSGHVSSETGSQRQGWQRSVIVPSLAAAFAVWACAVAYWQTTVLTMLPAAAAFTIVIMFRLAVMRDREAAGLRDRSDDGRIRIRRTGRTGSDDLIGQEKYRPRDGAERPGISSLLISTSTIIGAALLAVMIIASSGMPLSPMSRTSQAILETGGWLLTALLSVMMLHPAEQRRGANARTGLILGAVTGATWSVVLIIAFNYHATLVLVGIAECGVLGTLIGIHRSAEPARREVVRQMRVLFGSVSGVAVALSLVAGVVAPASNDAATEPGSVEEIVHAPGEAVGAARQVIGVADQHFSRGEYASGQQSYNDAIAMLDRLVDAYARDTVVEQLRNQATESRQRLRDACDAENRLARQRGSAPVPCQ